MTIKSVPKHRQMSAGLPLIENHCPGSLRSTKALLIPWFPAVVLSWAKALFSASCPSLESRHFYPSWFSTSVAFKKFIIINKLEIVDIFRWFLHFNHTILNYGKPLTVIEVPGQIRIMLNIEYFSLLIALYWNIVTVQLKYFHRYSLFASIQSIVCILSHSV